MAKVLCKIFYKLHIYRLAESISPSYYWHLNAKVACGSAKRCLRNKMEDDKGCENCFYEEFDMMAYPCAICVRGIERTDKWKPKDITD